VHRIVHDGLLQVALFSQVNEGRLVHFHQRLSQKRESDDSAVSATVSVSAVPGTDEWGTLAGHWRAGAVDMVGDGLTQVAGEGGPCWLSLTWIALTRVLERVGRVLGRIIVASFVGFCGIVGHWAGGSVVNTQGGLRVGAGWAEGRGRRWATTAAQTPKGGRSAEVSGGTAALPNDMMLDRATAPA
jgi:hypothetical protein